MRDFGLGFGPTLFERRVLKARVFQNWGEEAFGLFPEEGTGSP